MPASVSTRRTMFFANSTVRARSSSHNLSGVEDTRQDKSSSTAYWSWSYASISTIFPSSTV